MQWDQRDTEHCELGGQELLKRRNIIWTMYSGVREIWTAKKRPLPNDVGREWPRLSSLETAMPHLTMGDGGSEIRLIFSKAAHSSPNLLQSPIWDLAQSKYLIYVYWMNEWVNGWMINTHD